VSALTILNHDRAMEADLQSRRCPYCGADVTGLARFVNTLNGSVVERFEDGPPTALPADAIGVDWLLTPCLHALTPMHLWDAAVEAGWGNDVAAVLCTPTGRRSLIA